MGRDSLFLEPTLLLHREEQSFCMPVRASAGMGGGGRGSGEVGVGGGVVGGGRQCEGMRGMRDRGRSQEEEVKDKIKRSRERARTQDI